VNAQAHLLHLTDITFRPRRRTPGSQVTSLRHPAAEVRLPAWVFDAPWSEAVNRMAQLLTPERPDERIEQSAFETAVSFMTQHLGRHTATPAVVPIDGGGVQLEWHRGGVDLEVACFPDHSVETWVEDLTTGDERVISTTIGEEQPGLKSVVSKLES
jgi:hypothetical protein